MSVHAGEPTPWGRARGALPARRPGRCRSWRPRCPSRSAPCWPSRSWPRPRCRPSTPPAWTAGRSRGPGPWEVVGDLLAGATLDRLPDGRAVTVATGAALPAGADAVLRRERGLILDDGGGGRLYVGDPASGQTAPHPGYVEPGSDVRPRGQEAAAGEHLLEAGGVVTPAVVGHGGRGRLRPPRRRPPARHRPARPRRRAARARPGARRRVRDALGPMLPGWVAWAGGRCFPPVHVPDTLEALLAELEDANADVVVTTGSTAAGPADHLHARAAPARRALGRRRRGRAPRATRCAWPRCPTGGT